MTSLVAPALEIAAVVVLVTAWISLIQRRIDALVDTYAIQSAALGLTAGLLAFQLQSPDLYALAGLTVAVNAIVLPWLLRRVIRTLGVSRMVNMYASVRESALAGLAILLGSVWVVGPLTPFAAVPSAGLLPISVAVLLIGFFLIITRRKAITQVVGLLVMNNGIFLSGIALTYGLGLFVELGLAANLLVLAIVARIFLERMKGSFDHVDADALRALKG
jgi:hydrogenase-4 component E